MCGINSLCCLLLPHGCQVQHGSVWYLHACSYAGLSSSGAVMLASMSAAKEKLMIVQHTKVVLLRTLVLLSVQYSVYEQQQ